MFKNCQFAEDYADARLPDFKAQISDFLMGKEVKSKMIAYIAIMAISVARLLPESSVCYTDEKKCLKELPRYSSSCNVSQNIALNPSICPAVY